MSKRTKSRFTKPNYLYSVLSVALVLFLLGSFALVLLHANQLLKIFKERVNVMVELKPETQDLEKRELEDYLTGSAVIKQETLKFFSKEEAAKMMEKDFGDDFTKLNLQNPFNDAFTFNINADYLSTENLKKLKKDVIKYRCVSDIYYQENLIEDIAKNLKNISYFALGIGLLFLFIAITLIHNTIRLALYSNRFLIKNMQLVGASMGFIRRPYLKRSLFHGILSGFLASLGVGVVLASAWNNLPELKNMLSIEVLVLIFVSIILSGIFLYFISTFFSLNKYLKLRTDKLY